jgi:hypothetical protein
LDVMYNNAGLVGAMGGIEHTTVETGIARRLSCCAACSWG